MFFTPPAARLHAQGPATQPTNPDQMSRSAAAAQLQKAFRSASWMRIHLLLASVGGSIFSFFFFSAEVKEEPVEGVFVDLVNDNLFEWKCYIEGPKDTA
jgi:hypothetical protein